MCCVGKGAHLAQPSTEWTAYLLARSPCARSVSQPSSADCLAALVASLLSVIKGLRREEAGQATVFSKRALSHVFQAKLPVRLKRRFLLSVYQ